MKRETVVFSAFVLAAGVSSCSATRAVPTEGSEAPIWVSASSPAVGTSLPRGSTVDMTLTFTCSVDYPGRVTLAFRDQTGASLVASATSLDVDRRGDARIQTSFDVPAAASSIRLTASFRPADPSHPPTYMIADFAAQ